MVPSPEQLAAIAQSPSGDFARVPFAVLLHALASQKRSAVVEMQRGPIEKRIVLETGVPIDCRSNLAHETFGRFLVAQGKLREEEMTAGLAKSATLGVPLGQVLLQQELITAMELFRFLQQNLARKLLDAFTWRTGTYKVISEVPPADSTLKMKPAQLVVTGVLKFTPQEEADSSIIPLIGKRLGLHPAPVFPLDEIRLSAEQSKVVERLAARARIDEIAAAVQLPYEDVSRLLYALAILGIVVPEEQIPRNVAPTAPKKVDAPAPAPKASTAVSLEDEILRNEMMQIYLGYRGKDAFELLVLPEEATETDIRRAYVELSRKVAPWRYDGPALEPLREKAEEVYLAAARAFAELAFTESRMTLLHRRRTLREEKRRSASAGAYAIKTDLLDPEVQYRKGLAHFEAGRLKDALTFLEFAADCDAQNATYGAEVAWCRYRMSPVSNAAGAMKSLRELIRRDPEAGLAHFYAGEIARERGDAAEAEPLLRKASKLLAPDRRPVEALKMLAARK
jgi:tetratricopeptide (TPR) repeat protein